MKSVTMPCVLVPKAYRAAPPQRPVAQAVPPPVKSVELSAKTSPSWIIEQSELTLNQRIQPGPLQQFGARDLTAMLTSLSQEILNISSKLQDFEMRMAGLEAR